MYVNDDDDDNNNNNNNGEMCFSVGHVRAVFRV